MMDSQTFPFEIKSIAESGVIEGVVSAFGKVDAYGDTIAPGAYAKSIERLRKSGRKLPLLYQHDRRRPIGVWADLRESTEGLLGKADLAMEVPDAKSAHALAHKGALTGISIGYEIAANGVQRMGNRRVLTDIVLHEASLVTFPADDHARVTAVKAISGPSDIEELLRNGGFSGRKAKAAASAAWKAINEQTDDEAALAELTALVRASAARLSEGN